MSQKGIFSGSLPMKKKYVSLILLIATCLAILSSMPTRASAAGEPEGYGKAKVDLERLRDDPKRAKYRHSWLKLADDFQELYDDNPSWNNRPAALFRSAVALEEMARRSYNRKDAQNAAALSNNWQKNIPQAFWPTTRYIGRRSSATNSCATPEKPALFW